MRFYAIAVLAIAAAGAGTQPFSCFPRMRDQPSIEPYEKEMPEMPPGLVPWSGEAGFPPAGKTAASIPNPVEATPEAVNLGRLYYGYYCATCHGRDGTGDGSVGRSYDPRPTDLTGPEVRAMVDGELALKMVEGAGHEPVLDSTVPVARRWFIVHYMRTLGSGAESPEPPPPAGGPVLSR